MRVKLATDAGTPHHLVNQGISYTAKDAPGDGQDVAVKLVAAEANQQPSVEVADGEIVVNLETNNSGKASVTSQGITYRSVIPGADGDGKKVRLSLNDEGEPLTVATSNALELKVLLEKTGGARATMELPGIVYEAAEYGEAGNQIRVIHSLAQPGQPPEAVVNGNVVTVKLARSWGDYATGQLNGSSTLSFTAVDAGPGGNDISVNVATATVEQLGQPLSVNVDGKNITVVLATNINEPYNIISSLSEVGWAIQNVAGNLVNASGGGNEVYYGGSTILSGGGDNYVVESTAQDVAWAIQNNPEAAALIRVANLYDNARLSLGSGMLQGGEEGEVLTTTAEVVELLTSPNYASEITVIGSGSATETVQPGVLVMNGGATGFGVESTVTDVVEMLHDEPAVTDLITVSGSGSTKISAMARTPLSGGTARASVSTASAVANLLNTDTHVASKLAATVTGSATTVLQPTEVALSGGVNIRSVSTVSEIVSLLSSTPAVTALMTVSGSGETVVTATDGPQAFSGGGLQYTPTGTTSYAWDVPGRLASVTLPTGQVHSYRYDYRTRRIGTQQTAQGESPAKHTSVLFSGGLSLAEYESLTPQTILTTPTVSTVRYVRGPDMGGGVGGLLYSSRSGVAKYNLSNGRGDIVAQSDASANLTWTASYEAYGKRTKETGVNADKQRANSKDEDPTGLLNEGFRYRDIETGSWLSRDPAGFVDGPNLYAYVKQNPWTMWDPLGLMTPAGTAPISDSTAWDGYRADDFKAYINGGDANKAWNSTDGQWMPGYGSRPGDSSGQILDNGYGGYVDSRAQVSQDAAMAVAFQEMDSRKGNPFAPSQPGAQLPGRYTSNSKDLSLPQATTIGKISIEKGARPSAEEVHVGQFLSLQGYGVTHLKPINTSQVRTPDLWMSGYGKVDIMTAKKIRC